MARGVLRPGLALLTLLVAGCSDGESPVGSGVAEGAGPDASGATGALPAKNLQAEAPQEMEFRRLGRWWGTVASARRAPARAMTSGRIIDMEVEDGALVSTGEVLFRLGGPVLEARTAELQAKLETAKAVVELSRKLFENETEALAKRLGTARQREIAAAELKKSEIELEASRRSLDAHKAALAVTAPISGKLLGRRVVVGQDVEAGEPLAEVLDPEDLWIEAETFAFKRNEREQAIGMEALIKQMTGKNVDGRIVLIHPESGSMGSTRFRMRAVGLEEAFRPGDPVWGSVVLEVRRALGVPTGAVVRDDDGSAFVFVADGSEWERRAVVTGLTENESVEIVSGLTSTDKVVTSGAYRLLHGSFRDLYREED